jgi:4-hydroxy-3-methylbut-2-en-1-yl diphosphate reductase
VAGIAGNTDGKTLLLLKPRGFCAGVVRAIDVVRIALEAFGPPIYVRKEIVHNSFVVEELRGKGAIFVDSEDEVPNGERIIYSAHGVSPEVREHSAKRGLRVIDATCPLVTKVHVEAVKFAKEGYSLILAPRSRRSDWNFGRGSARNPGGGIAGAGGVARCSGSETGGLSDADDA